IKEPLSDGDYAAAFDTFAELCDDFITKARTGKPYDSGNMPKEPMKPGWILVAVIVGFILSFITVGSMKNKLKTVRFQPAANSYMKAGSMNITESRDLFLYNTVTRTAKPKDNDSGGGSSTHTSSSGSSHGGGGGNF
ncbi:MAG: TPM domain-containing protein, partial [Ruminococcaceae bacterium]|nr:TPM domain-containing protein [Oscillospiraceae bacterium]